jgi:putative tryptophan/tyrosine transport system substrate-binding protein
MIFLVKRLGLGFALIALASGVLLATDRTRRRSDTGPVMYRVALLQHTSTVVLDESATGVIDGLAERGFRQGVNLELTRFNPQGDAGTSAAMAREIVNGPYDLVITVSTLSLQAIANANKQRRMPHVFGIVADPYSAVPGLDRAEPARHPPYMTGQGIFLPVEESFRLARQMYPNLKDVGVVWNPAESNSRVFVSKAREICQAMGINLLESATENSAGVLEATRAVIGRGAQAIWAGGDVSVSVAMDAVLNAARKAGIPVFSILPGKPDRGELLEVGVSFYECGKLTGFLAADVLQGKDPASIPIRDVMDLVPHLLVVNRLALKDLKDPWTVPDDLAQKADIVVDENGVHKKTKR